MTREEFIHHVESTQKAFRRFLVALCCGDTLLADDIAQEAYIKAYLTCDGFRKQEKFSAWIYRIGYNTFLNHKRSDKKLCAYEEVAEIQGKDSAEAEFRYQDLYLALECLSAMERTTILLYYMEGYDVKEISKLESVSPEAVRQHLSRGRKHLRKILDNRK